jgi:hypothetical protein
MAGRLIDTLDCIDWRLRRPQISELAALYVTR